MVDGVDSWINIGNRIIQLISKFLRFCKNPYFVIVFGFLLLIIFLYKPPSIVIGKDRDMDKRTIEVQKDQITQLNKENLSTVQNF
jgi:hypothetical protein